jgi:hypothetical protein
MGTTVSVLILGAFVYSTRRCIAWDSPNLQHEVMLWYGSIGYSWRLDGWRLDAERYPISPGWSVAGYGGQPTLYWWFMRDSNRSWESITLPLWIPLLLAVTPTTIVWLRDRRSTLETIHSWLDRIRPRQRRKVTFWLVAICCALHAGMAVAAVVGLLIVYPFFVDYRPGDRVFQFLEGAILVFMLTSPLWAILWALVWTRAHNRLFDEHQGAYCPQCGYNLTGNVSGICSECGRQLSGT